MKQEIILRVKRTLEIFIENNGQIKGGQNSIFNNDIIKDENGKFKGSSRRHG